MLKSRLARHCHRCYSTKRKLILGLESSADDTCAAIVGSDRTILSNIVLKQQDLFNEYGGIHPYHSVARHSIVMPKAIEMALQQAKVTYNDLDAIAYTRGPGMSASLATCSTVGRSLSALLSKPSIGVHHMQAHALTPFLTEKEPPEYPFLTLLVSGGHTLLLLAKSPCSFEIIANCEDQPIGNAFDKVARLLNISWGENDASAGASLESFARGASPTEEHGFGRPEFPIGCHGQLKFSYSGLVTSVDRHIRSLGGLSKIPESYQRLIALEFQRAAFGQVYYKIRQALEKGPFLDRVPAKSITSLVVSGGVASNQYLRESLRQSLDKLGYKNMRLIFPPGYLCTDNAAMISYVAFRRLEQGKTDPLDREFLSKWSIEDCERDFDK